MSLHEAVEPRVLQGSLSLTWETTLAETQATDATATFKYKELSSLGNRCQAFPAPARASPRAPAPQRKDSKTAPGAGPYPSRLTPGRPKPHTSPG